MSYVLIPPSPRDTGATDLSGGQQDWRDASHIDPKAFSPVTSDNRLQSLRYATSGCRYMLRRQKNTRIQALATLIVVSLSLWLRLPALELALLTIAISLVWIAEFINGAIEAAVNLASPQPHPMAKVAKDVAAGSVLLAVLASLLIGALILGPALWQALPMT